MSGSSNSPSSAPTSPVVTSSTMLKALVLLGSSLEADACTVGAAHGLSANEWLILDALSATPGLSMSEISLQTLSSGASLTRAVDRLVSRSLVYRAPSMSDRRKVEVRISDLGRSVLADMSVRLAGVENALRSALSDAGIDHRVFAAVLAEFSTAPSAD